MKIKHKIGFVALVTVIDIMVIILVIMNNGKTNIKNDVSNKTSANILKSVDLQEVTEEPVEEVEKIDENSIDINENVELIEENEVIEVESYPVYDEMSIEEKEIALNEGTLPLEYSALYTNSEDRLTVSRGALYFNNHKETYYSEKVLPGTSLNIPGRHVADDGTIRDENGYICVAANYDYMPKGSILITSLGPAKVYDTGCAYGTIDIYVSW